MNVSGKIHPTAIIHPDADISENVSVGPFSIIDENVSIGKGTVIGNNVTITGRTTIGNNKKHNISTNRNNRDKNNNIWVSLWLRIFHIFKFFSIFRLFFCSFSFCFLTCLKSGKKLCVNSSTKATPRYD